MSKNKALVYGPSATGILLAVIHALVGSTNEFECSAVNPNESEIDKLIDQDKKDAKKQGRDRILLRVPMIWDYVTQRPGVKQVIEAFHWDLTDSNNVLYLQKVVQDINSVEAQLLLAKAATIGSYLEAISDLPEFHPLAHPTVEAENEEPAKDEKKYKDVTKGKGKEALKNLGKELEKDKKSK